MVLETLRYDMNLRVLKRANADIVSLHGIASHASLYRFDGASEQWIKLNVEGPIIIYKKTSPSHTGVHVLNRMELNNFDLPLQDCSIAYHDPFLMLHTPELVYGIWIHDDIEREAMFSGIEQAIKVAHEPPQQQKDIPPGFEQFTGLYDVERTVKSSLGSATLEPLSKEDFESRVIQLVHVIFPHVGWQVHGRTLPDVFPSTIYSINAYNDSEYASSVDANDAWCDSKRCGSIV